MQNKNIEFIKLLQNQKTIRIIFIFLNILAWSADELTQQDLIKNTETNTKTTENTYNLILIISILINIYYIFIIQKQIEDGKEKSQNIEQLETQKKALIILIIALSILLYTQLSKEN